MPGVKLSPPSPGFPSGSPPREAASEQATETGPQLRSDVKVFHEPEVAPLGTPLLHFAVDRFVDAVGQHGVDDGGEKDINEHLHGGLPERDRHPSAYV